MTHAAHRILGATGSIGDSTLDVIARHPDRFAVAALTAHAQWEKLARAVPSASAGPCRRCAIPRRRRELERALAARRSSDARARRRGRARRSRARCRMPTPSWPRSSAPRACARRSPPRARGKRILLANKEALVIGGAAFMRAVEAGRATLLPIDSEHNAIFQCLPPGYARKPAAAGVRRILLTASGGPFRTRAARGTSDGERGRSLRPSELGDGAQDQRRLGDDDEQGSRDDRSALAVRRAAGADRGRRPSGERHPFARRIR